MIDGLRVPDHIVVEARSSRGRMIPISDKKADLTSEQGEYSGEADRNFVPNGCRVRPSTGRNPFLQLIIVISC